MQPARNGDLTAWTEEENYLLIIISCFAANKSAALALAFVPHYVAYCHSVLQLWKDHIRANKKNICNSA